MEYGVNPDIVTTAKAIAGGLPFAAILFSEKTEKTLGFGQHATTFGGNPICAAAAYTIIKRIDDKLLNHVKEMRKLIENRLKDVPEIKSISGKGLMVGITLDENIKAADVVGKGIKNGVIMLTAKQKVRLLPPLTITEEELNLGLDLLIKSVKEAK